MKSFEDYLNEHVNYSPKKVREYIKELQWEYVDGSREDFNDIFDTTEKYFKENGLEDYTPLYEVDATWDGDDDCHGAIDVYYFRDETDSEYSKRIENAERNARRDYEWELNKERRAKLAEIEERELYEKLKKKYG